MDKWRPFLISLLLFFTVIKAGVPKTGTATTTQCPTNMFKCPISGRCIPNSWKCDGDSDCENGEDEETALCKKHEQRCNPGEYECESAKDSSNPGYIFHLTQSASLFSHNCIPEQWKCDGEFDCPNKDDERHCTSITCGENQFPCNTTDGRFGSCIPMSWKCDGQADCNGGEDEHDCKEEPKKCDSTEFTCNDGSCIYNNWHCDGDEDCLDGSDELQCENKETCDPATKFKCLNVSFCIPKSWRCDGEADCIDRSDEMNCQTYHPSRTVSECHSKNEFKCESGAECISKEWLCDGDLDCSDGSDESEKNCPEFSKKCAFGESHCKNSPHKCISNSSFCDGTLDCHDGSDEEAYANGTTCIKPKTHESQDCNPDTQYKCPLTTTVCVDYHKLCTDDTHNCITGEICKKDIVLCNKENKNCIHHTSMNGKDVYACASGYRNTQPNDMEHGECEDIDECANIGICDHKCINIPGSFRCECYNGFKLSYAHENRSESTKTIPTKCRAMGADPILLLSNRASIRQYDLSTNRYLKFVDKLDSAVAMDYWLKNKTIIWSDVAQEKIYYCNMTKNALFPSMVECDDNGHGELVSTNISTPDGLAVDWIHGLLFWTDTGKDTISVMDLNTRKRKVLIHEGLDEPRAIAVDPSRGLIFWTDWGANARIERASMDGSNRQTIISDSNIVRWPNGITLDIFDQRIYWADAKTKMIASADYDGKNVRTVLQSHAHIKHPFALAVFEEKVYWTDWDREGVLVMNKFHGSDVKTLTSGVTGPMTVRVYHSAVQPEHENKCQGHMCTDAICLPKGYTFEANGKPVAPTGLTYSCGCLEGYKIGDEPTMCVIEQMIASAIDENVGSRFSLAFMLFILIVAFFGIVGYVYTKRRHTRLDAFHFENPVYRRTVEELDPEMDAMVDTSLGPISANVPFSGQQAAPKLVLGTANIDFRDPTQYGYDQPPPSYDQASSAPIEKA